MHVLNSAELLICLACVVLALKNTSNNTKVHASFAAMMGCIGLLAFELLLLELDYMNFIVKWYWISGIATVSVPACFYLYFSASLRLESQFRWQDLLHFIPAFIYFVLSLPYALLPLEQQYEISGALTNRQPLDWAYQLTPVRPVRMGMVAILTALYLPLCWHELHHEMSQKKQDVLTELRHYKWIILIFGVVFVFSFVIFLTRPPISHNWIISGVMFPIIAAFAFLYWRLPQWGHNWQKDQLTEVINHQKEISLASDLVEKTEETSVDRKYRSSVNEDIADSILDKLMAAMQQGLFKDSTLTLRKLANELGISQHHLSQIINENTDGNYYDLVNGYRLGEAKRLLIETELSIIDVAYNSGFNSKSAFYSEFKKQTGKTPGQFRGPAPV